MGADEAPSLGEPAAGLGGRRERLRSHDLPHITPAPSFQELAKLCAPVVSAYPDDAGQPGQGRESPRAASRGPSASGSMDMDELDGAVELGLPATPSGARAESHREAGPWSQRPAGLEIPATPPRRPSREFSSRSAPPCVIAESPSRRGRRPLGPICALGHVLMGAGRALRALKGPAEEGDGAEKDATSSTCPVGSVRGSEDVACDGRSSQAPSPKPRLHGPQGVGIHSHFVTHEWDAPLGPIDESEVALSTPDTVTTPPRHPATSHGGDGVFHTLPSAFFGAWDAVLGAFRSTPTTPLKTAARVATIESADSGSVHPITARMLRRRSMSTGELPPSPPALSSAAAGRHAETATRAAPVSCVGDWYRPSAPERVDVDSGFAFGNLKGCAGVAGDAWGSVPGWGRKRDASTQTAQFGWLLMDSWVDADELYADATPAEVARAVAAWCLWPALLLLRVVAGVSVLVGALLGVLLGLVQVVLVGVQALGNYSVEACLAMVRQAREVPVAVVRWSQWAGTALKRASQASHKHASPGSPPVHAMGARRHVEGYSPAHVARLITESDLLQFRYMLGDGVTDADLVRLGIPHPLSQAPGSLFGPPRLSAGPLITGHEGVTETARGSGVTSPVSPSRTAGAIVATSAAVANATANATTRAATHATATRSAANTAAANAPTTTSATAATGATATHAAATHTAATTTAATAASPRSDGSHGASSGAESVDTRPNDGTGRASTHPSPSEGWDRVTGFASESMRYELWRRPWRAGLMIYKARSVYFHADLETYRRFHFDDLARKAFDDSLLCVHVLPADPAQPGWQPELDAATPECAYMYNRVKFPPPFAQRDYTYARRVFEAVPVAGPGSTPAARGPSSPQPVVYFISRAASHAAEAAVKRRGRCFDVRDMVSCGVMRQVTTRPDGPAVEVDTLYYDNGGLNPAIVNAVVAKGMLSVMRNQENAFREFQRIAGSGGAGLADPSAAMIRRARRTRNAHPKWKRRLLLAAAVSVSRGLLSALSGRGAESGQAKAGGSSGTGEEGAARDRPGSSSRAKRGDAGVSESRGRSAEVFGGARAGGASVFEAPPLWFEAPERRGEGRGVAGESGAGAGAGVRVVKERPTRAASDRSRLGGRDGIEGMALPRLQVDFPAGGFPARESLGRTRSFSTNVAMWG